MNETEDYFLNQIANGPNVRLYERLMGHKDRFTAEQIILGIQPLFFGKEISMDMVVAYLNGEFQEYAAREDEKRRGKSLYDQEKDRIQELVTGEFKLPQSVAGLLENADMWIAENQDSSDMIERNPDLFTEDLRAYPNGFFKPMIKALEEVKQKITQLKNEGLLE